jgi:hypothetical protein
MKIFYPTITEDNGFQYIDQMADCIQKRVEDWLYNGGDIVTAGTSLCLSLASLFFSLASLFFSIHL